MEEYSSSYSNQQKKQQNCWQQQSGGQQQNQLNPSKANHQIHQIDRDRTKNQNYYGNSYANVNQNHSSSYEVSVSKNPFVIQPYTKDDRIKQKQMRPKLGIKRLTEDRKLASVQIDIPIDENTVLREKFDWDLSKDKVSVFQFSREFVNALNLPSEYVQKIRQQILSQIMEHIKNNTRQKIQQDRDFIEQHLYARNLQAMRFNNEDHQQEGDRDNQKKKMSRMRRTQMKRTNITYQTTQNKYFREKKVCRNCKNQNVTPGFECKNCKLPFQLLQMLNFDDRRVKLSAKYYQKIANKIPLLVYQAKKRHFQKDDFDSFYAIYNKIRSIFETCDQLSKQNLNQVKYIMQKYHQYFLNGHIQFNDQQIIQQIAYQQQ